MASISTDSSGCRRIQFVNEEGKRKAIRLGKVSLRKAEEWIRHIEQMSEATRFSQNLDLATQSWAEGLSDELYEKLVSVGLMPSRQTHVSRLKPFLDTYIEGRKDVKPATKIVWNQVSGSLVSHFGADRKLSSITEADADDFKQHLIGEGFASTTVHKRLQFSRMLFKQAMKRRVISRNPFAEVSATAVIPEERKSFVNRDIIEKLLTVCDTTWKSIIGLARYGGLRTPSETLSLRWEDIDWAKRRVLVTSPKTEHLPDGATRLMPLFPELAAILKKALEEAPKDAVYVVDERYRKPAMTANGWANANLRTQLLRLLNRVDLKSWPRLFHNLRASRETELVAQFPIHVVAHWLGNTPEIAMKHYLRVTEADFANAASGPVEVSSTLVTGVENCIHDADRSNSESIENGGAESGAVVAQKQAQHTSAGESTHSQESTQVVKNKGDMQSHAISCKALHTPQMEAGGIEPPSRDTSNPASTCIVDY